MDWKYLFTSREGRINRKPFWLGILVLFIVTMLVMFILTPFVGLLSFVVLIPIWLASLMVMVMVKRSHDRGRPEWYVYGYALLSLVLAIGTYFVLGAAMLDPAAAESAMMSSNSIALFILNIVTSIWGLVLIIDLGFLRGTRGPNQYGPDPLG